ncbi:MAG: hypothetical protein ACFBQW_00980 [Sphingomonadaceae bacterium]
MGILLVGSALLSACATPASAQQQVTAEEALQNAFQAEHRAWQEDAGDWRSDHRHALEILQTISRHFQNGDGELRRHIDMIERHRDMLERRDDLAGMADHHARMRTRHEEMREAHHHMMDAINMLERAIEDDMPATELPPEAQ